MSFPHESAEGGYCALMCVCVFFSVTPILHFTSPEVLFQGRNFTSPGVLFQGTN